MQISPPSRAASQGLTEHTLYCREIQFENLKCFSGSHSLSFLDGEGNPSLWNLLVGENGVGKTTLLKLVAWMRPEPPPKEKTSVEPALFADDNSALLGLVRHQIPAITMRLQAVFGPAQHSGNNLRLVTTGLTVDTTDGVLPDREKLTDIRLTENSPWSAELPAPNVPIVAYGANRQIGLFNLSDTTMQDPISPIFAPVTNLFDPEEILSSLDYAKEKGTKGATERLDQFLNLIADVVPGIKLVENIIFEGPSINGDPKQLRGIKYRTPYGLVPFQRMSLGYQTTLAWATDLGWRMVQRYPTSPAPFVEPAIVLIDEIDLHLHPIWQRDLRAYLRRHFPSVQFIATAHSPLMAQASLDANVVVLEEEGDHVKIDSDGERLSDWRIDQIVTSLFGVSARPPQIEAMIKERDRLLDIINRSADEEKELEELTQTISQIALPETRSEREATSFIERAAARLREAGVHE